MLTDSLWLDDNIIIFHERHLVNKQKNQQGSAHVIVIAILVLALLGTLGFIFWQNFMKPSSDLKIEDINNSSEIVDESNELTQIAEDQTFGTNLAIKYPRDWIVTHASSTKNGMGLDNSILTSSDGGVKINFSVGVGGVGGFCAPNESIISFIDTDTIPKYSNAIFVSAVTKISSANEYTYYMGISNNNDQKKTLTIGDDSCPISLLSNMVSPGSLPSGHLQLYATFSNVENGISTSLDDFNQIKTTQNYITAKDIIQSLYIKE